MRIPFTPLLSTLLFPLLALAQDAVTFPSPTYKVGDRFEYMTSSNSQGATDDTGSISDYKWGLSQVHTILAVDAQGKATKIKLEVKEHRAAQRRYKKGAKPGDYEKTSPDGPGCVFEGTPVAGTGNAWNLKLIKGEAGPFSKSMTEKPKTLPFNLQPELPAKALKKGDTWELEEKYLSGFMGDQVIDKGGIKFTYEGMFEKDGRRLAKIAEEVKVTFQFGHLPENVEGTLAVDGRGAILADPETGKVVSRTATSSSVSTMIYNGEVDNPSINTTPRSIMQMRYRKLK